MEPLFKVGEKVRVKRRIGDKYDYKFSFIDEMAALAGREFTIRNVIPNKNDSKKPVPDDNALYQMNEIGHNWSSGMLEKISTSSVTVGSRKGVKLNFKV